MHLEYGDSNKQIMIFISSVQHSKEPIVDVLGCNKNLRTDKKIRYFARIC